jgi:hypothetical protein
MSDRKLEIDTKAIRPRALRTLGLDACIVILGLACDLRDGKIESFSMKCYFSACGTPCCIAGHLLERLGHARGEEGFELLKAWSEDNALFNLFSPSNPNKPLLAARAIERYVLGGADDPWGK